MCVNKNADSRLAITRLSKASWFKIKSDNKTIYFDPGFTGYFNNQGIPINELEDKADVILITHSHKDHLQPEAIEKIIKEDTVIIAPANCTNRIKYKMTAVKPGDSLDVGEIEVIAVDAYNTEEGHSTRKVHHKGTSVGFIIVFEDRRIYFAGDTDFIPEMNNYGDIDIAFLPIGGTFVMDTEEATNAVEVIKPKVTFPMHQSRNDQELFKSEVEAKSNSIVKILNMGDKAYA